MIEQSGRQSDVRIDFGGAIQTDSLTGGKFRHEPRPFEFTYFAGSAKWLLRLSEEAIVQIAAGAISSMELYACRDEGCRRMTSAHEDLCPRCDYFDDPDFGTFQVSNCQSVLELHGIPNLTDSATRGEIAELLGQPAATGGGAVLSGLAVEPWTSHVVGRVNVRVGYAPDGTATSVHITPVD